MESAGQQEAVIRQFAELTEAFDSLRLGGQQLCDLTKSLLTLAFRDIAYTRAGGSVVPQLGERTGHQLLFELPPPLEPAADLPDECENAISTAWSHARTTGLQIDLPLLSPPAQFLFQPISSGFTRPIGYYWTLVPHRYSRYAQYRLEYVAKYLAIATKAEKASHALDLLSEMETLKSATIENTAGEIAHACRTALSASTVIVWLPDHVKKRLRTTATAIAGERTSRLRVDMQFDQGVAGKCFTDGKLKMIDDLQDPHELHRLNLTPHHVSLVGQRKWRSAMFVPLDIGDTVAGVMSAYGVRPRGFSSIDLKILLAFAHRFSASLANIERMNHLTEMELRIEAEAPSIEAGMLAMENVHDSVNSLTLAQNSLTLVAQMMSKDRHGRLYDEVHSAIGQLRSAKKGIAALTKRAKFAKLTPARFLLKALLVESADRVSSEAEDLKVSMHISCAEHIALRADREKLSRVIVNLLHNALWFIQHDTKGAAHVISISASLVNKTLQIVIRDNGPGIAPYDLGKVFDYFFTTKGDRGMGFGLALAKRIVQLHGGSIVAESKWGYWTEMKIELPSSLVV